VGKTLAKNGFAMPQPFFGMTQRLLDVLHVETTNILEFDWLEQIPDPLLWIELRLSVPPLFSLDLSAEINRNKSSFLLCMRFSLHIANTKGYDQ
jgi:hypothetical protein